jgi:hypothetical protein
MHALSSGQSGIVLWHVTMSLDGFVPGPGDAVDWVFGDDSGPNAEVENTLRSLGTVAGGRRSLAAQRARHNGRERAAFRAVR